MQQFHALPNQVLKEISCAGDVGTRTVEARHQATADGVNTDCKHNRNGHRRRLCGARGSGATCNDHGDLATHEVGGQRRQPINLAFRPPKFEHDVSALDIAGFSEAGAESRHNGVHAPQPGPRSIEITDHRHRRLLRPRRQGPRRRAPEPRNERPTPHRDLPR